jgi:hypothetical protein
MSSALASARKRRGVNVNAPPPPMPSSGSNMIPPNRINQQPINRGPSATNTQPVPSSNPMTLQQVISLLDKRIITLETQIKNNVSTDTGVDTTTNNASIMEYINEFQHRFNMLADEINNIKDTVIKLQTYTMDVNRLLIEERIQNVSNKEDNNDTDPSIDLNATISQSNTDYASLLSSCDNNDESNILLLPKTEESIILQSDELDLGDSKTKKSKKNKVTL